MNIATREEVFIVLESKEGDTEVVDVFDSEEKADKCIKDWYDSSPNDSILTNTRWIENYEVK